MSTFRINKTKNFTVISNIHLKEKKMSLKAKGLLTVMLSLPPDWDYSLSGLVSICKENEFAVKTTLKELKMFGYLRIDMIKPNESETKRIEYVYNIYEYPLPEDKRQKVNKQQVKNQPTDYQSTEKQQVDKQGQLNTNTLSTKDELAKEYGLSIIKSFTNNRKKKLSELLEKFTQEEILETMFKIKNINFLLGRTDKSNWKISFDDFLNEEKFIKILEGAYYDEVKSTGRKQDKKIAKPKSAGTKKEYGF